MAIIVATMLPRPHHHSRLHHLTPRLVAFACAAACWLAPTAAQAEQPLPDLSDQATWTPNGPVQAIATIRGTAYIGGNFSYVGPKTGSGFLLDPATGASDISPRIAGAVSLSTPDGTGGVYIQGTALRAVGGAASGQIAHIRSDGSVDPHFVTPEFVNDGVFATPDILSMVVIGNRLYVGGHFSKVGGKPRASLVALDKTTGAVLDMPYQVLDAAGQPGQVNALAAGPAESIYVGGRFEKVAGGAHPNLVRLDASGAVVGGGLTGNEPDGTVTQIEPAFGYLYLAGSFTKLGSSAGGPLRRYWSGGTVDTAWKPLIDGSVNDFDVASGSVYVVGTFTHIGGAPRSRAGAVATAGTGAARPWNPVPAGTVSNTTATSVRSVAVVGSTVFIGGDFASTGGRPRDGLAALDLDAGAAKPPDVSVGGPVNTISPAGSRIFVGGQFVSIGGVRRKRLAAIGADGRATAWNPGADRSVATLVASADGRLYAAGDFTNIGGAPRVNLAALSPSSNTALPFDPAPDNRVRGLAVSPDGGTLYAGGDFTMIGQGTPVARKYLAALDTATGAATGWNPNLDDRVFEVELGAGGGPLYAQGTFKHAGSQVPQPDRPGFATLDTATGAAGALTITSGGGAIQAMLLTPAGLYLAGGFNSVQGVERHGFAAIGADGLPTGFDPSAQANGGAALARAEDGTLLIGGNFVGLKASNRRSLAEVDALTGLPTAWHPLADQAVYDLAVDGRNLWVAGGGNEGVRPGGFLRRYVRPADPITTTPRPSLSPPSGGTIDTTPPGITGARLTRTRFAVSRKPTALAAAKRGTGVRLTLSEHASLALRVERRQTGRRGGGRCRPVTRRNAARGKCVRFVRIGTLRRADRAGEVSIAFSGRLGRHALKSGRYRFRIVAADAAGNRSSAVNLFFRVVK